MKRRTKALLVDLAVIVLGRRGNSTAPPEPEPPRVVPEGLPDPPGERLALGLLALATIAAVAFVAVYVLDRLPNQTQLLGATLGLALLAIAVRAHRHRPPADRHRGARGGLPARRAPEEQELVARIVAESGSRITRKRLFRLGLGAAGASLAVALLAPLASLGPVLDMDAFYRRRGGAAAASSTRAAVPLAAAEVEPGRLLHRVPARARTATRSPPARRRAPRPARARPAAGERGATPPTASSRTRRSARTPAARSRSTARRSSGRPTRSRRSSARATTRRSTPPPAAR